MKRLLISSLLLITVGCSMKTRRAEKSAPVQPPAIETSSEAAPATVVAKQDSGVVTHESAPAGHADASASEMHVTLKKDGKAVAAPTAASAHHGDVKDGVPADKAWGWLKNGNKRYLKGLLRKDGQTMKDIERLGAGQKPHTIVLSCSDSRVPPELVFDQKLGEIFVIRTAGPNLDGAVLATIEYAVAHLGPQLLVVMGHTSCGAVKAAMGSFGGKDVGSKWLNGLVAAMHLRLASFADKQTSVGLVEEGWANVNGVASELTLRSEIIKNAVENGQLTIRQALYDTGHGNVDFKD